MNPLALGAGALAIAGVLYLLLRRRPSALSVSDFTRIYVVGDSIAQGLSRYVPEDRRGLSVTHVGALMPTVANEVYAELAGQGLGPKDLFLVNVGTNDSYSTQLTREDMQARVDSFLRTLASVSPQTPVLWALPPAAALNEKYDRLRLALIQAEVPTVELVDPATYLASDGIHLSPAGYEAYMNQILTM